MHISGAKKKPVYCYNSVNGELLTEFEGLRIATRALNLKDSFYIRRIINTNKTKKIKFNGIEYDMLFKYKKEI
jgi:hypothetical protein